MRACEAEGAAAAEIVKFALMAPCGTTMLGGTVATSVLLLPKVMRAPPAGAGALSATVAVVALPAASIVGTVMEPTAGPEIAEPSTFSSATTAQGLLLTSLVAWKRM